MDNVNFDDLILSLTELKSFVNFQIDTFLCDLEQKKLMSEYFHGTYKIVGAFKSKIKSEISTYEISDGKHGFLISAHILSKKKEKYVS